MAWGHAHAAGLRTTQHEQDSAQAWTPCCWQTWFGSSVRLVWDQRVHAIETLAFVCVNGSRIQRHASHSTVRRLGSVLRCHDVGPQRLLGKLRVCLQVCQHFLKRAARVLAPFNQKQSQHKWQHTFSVIGPRPSWPGSASLNAGWLQITKQLNSAFSTVKTPAMMTTV